MKENGYETFAEMPPGMVSQYVVMLREEGKAPATVQTAAYAIKKYLKWVKDCGVDVPEMSAPDLPRIRHEVKEAMAPDDFDAFFRACDRLLEEPLRTAAMLLPCSGLRGQEMVKLRLIDLQKEDVLLKGGARKETIVLKPWGKGEKQRVVPLFDEGAELITGYLAGWRRNRKGGYVFPSPNSRHGTTSISSRALRGAIQVVRDHLGQEWTPHTMRRTYLTTLHRKGVDVATIAKIGGHANVQTLIKHYLSLNTGDLVGAVQNKGGSLMG